MYKIYIYTLHAPLCMYVCMYLHRYIYSHAVQSNIVSHLNMLKELTGIYLCIDHTHIQINMLQE